MKSSPKLGFRDFDRLVIWGNHFYQKSWILFITYSKTWTSSLRFDDIFFQFPKESLQIFQKNLQRFQKTCTFCYCFLLVSDWLGNCNAALYRQNVTGLLSLSLTQARRREELKLQCLLRCLLLFSARFAHFERRRLVLRS